MTLSKDNLETATRLLSAHVQRQDIMRQIVTQLGSGAIWRSPDGKLLVPIPEAEIAQLEEHLKAYLDEADLIATNLRAMMSK